VPSTDASVQQKSRGDSSATESLRRQLLGKNAVKRGSARSFIRIGTGSAPPLQKSKFPSKKSRRRDVSDDDEEEKGRSRPGKQNKSINATATLIPSDQDGNLVQESSSHLGLEANILPISTKPVKRGSSYLDQVLADRAAKKKRKKAALESDKQM
jgi:hypothetical protein